MLASNKSSKCQRSEVLAFPIIDYEGKIRLIQSVELLSAYDSPEDWLDSFNTFSIYQVLPQLIQLWVQNTQTDVQSKKTSLN